MRKKRQRQRQTDRYTEKEKQTDRSELRRVLKKARQGEVTFLLFRK